MKKKRREYLNRILIGLNESKFLYKGFFWDISKYGSHITLQGPTCYSFLIQLKEQDFKESSTIIDLTEKKQKDSEKTGDLNFELSKQLEKFKIELLSDQQELIKLKEDQILRQSYQENTKDVILNEMHEEKEQYNDIILSNTNIDDTFNNVLLEYITWQDVYKSLPF